MNTIAILESFDLPTSVNAFVQYTSQKAENDQSFIESLSDAFNIDISVVDQQQQLTYLQYAIVELIRDETITVDEACDVAMRKTDGLFKKHPYLQPNVNNETKKEAKVTDKKAHALQLYEANKDSKTLAELVNLIADELQISKANSRYYISRVFGHPSSK